jgi:hypothetical protein
MGRSMEYHDTNLLLNNLDTKVKKSPLRDNQRAVKSRSQWERIGVLNRRGNSPIFLVSQG